MSVGRMKKTLIGVMSSFVGIGFVENVNCMQVTQMGREIIQQLAQQTGVLNQTIQSLNNMTVERDQARNDLATVIGERDQARNDLATVIGERDQVRNDLATVAGERGSLVKQMQVYSLLSTLNGDQNNKMSLSNGDNNPNNRKNLLVLGVPTSFPNLLDTTIRNGNDFLVGANAVTGNNKVIFGEVLDCERELESCLYNNNTQLTGRNLGDSYAVFCTVVGFGNAAGLFIDAQSQPLAGDQLINALADHIIANAGDIQSGNYVNVLDTTGRLPVIDINNQQASDDLHSIDNIRWHLVRALVALAEFGDVNADANSIANGSDGLGYNLRTVEALSRLINCL
jgi:hypothetical protein